MKLLSLFTGIGGLDHGLIDSELAELVGFSEIKESSIEVFQNYNSAPNFGDITKIVPEKLPDFDILTGGFPCQSFSLMGLRKGIVDPRGKMIFHIYNILVTKQPEYFVLENVKGLLTHNQGRTYHRVLALLQSAGYYVRVLLLNSAHYGSAQNRERIIFLGSKKDFPKKTPEKRDDTKRFRDIREEGSDDKFKWLADTDFNRAKLFGERERTFEIIGGYDRVGTLLTASGGGEKVVYDQKRDWFRFLTPLECERLQGFEDGYTEGLSDTNRYFALGNAVNCDMSDYLFRDYLKGVWF